MTAALDPGRPFTGSERELLENTLDLNRRELVRAVEHLSDTQARAKLVPSLTTPISLVKHCAAAERIWFQRTLAGMSVDECDGHASG
ncbi:mini-circle protein, partial [Mycobacterium timonense]